MRNGTVVIALCAALAVAGCQRSGIGTGPSQPAPLPAPMPASPAGDMRTGQWPPAGPGDFPDPPTTPDPPTAPDAQALQALAATAPEVTRNAMVGRWTLSSGGNGCDLFLALTQWTGGYRAASRGCDGQAALIAAWDVAGNQVILKDSSGNRFAELYRSDEQRFDGTTAAGLPASLDR